MDLSIILPALDEAENLSALIPELRKQFADAEIIVVDDGSSDDTADVAEKAGARVVRHAYQMGNGAAIKSGIRQATGNIALCMDSDGQHRPEDAQLLIDRVRDGFDMAVGSRSRTAQSSFARRIANSFYNQLASLIVGHRVEDLTSGFRAFNRKKFIEFLSLLPNGFSYPTTITMAFFRAGYSVYYEPVNVRPNAGRSHIRPLKDGLRFILIIVKVGTLYSPLKFFVPLSFTLFGTGIAYYLYTFITESRFTNMSALLLSVGVITFLIGLVSEQVTTLLYQNRHAGDKQD